MSRRAHVWFLVAIIFLALATIIGFSQQQANLRDHEKLDTASCERALKNREILASVVETLAEDPDISQPSKTTLTNLDKELKVLIRTVNNCQES